MGVFACLALLLSISMSGCAATTALPTDDSAIETLRSQARREVPLDLGPITPPSDLESVLRSLGLQSSFDVGETLQSRVRGIAIPSEPINKNQVFRATADETRAYVRARIALAENNPQLALEHLAFATREDASPAAQRVLAAVYDVLGRSDIATRIRLQLAARGVASISDVLGAGESSLQRRRWDEAALAFALAIQMPSISSLEKIRASNSLAIALDEQGRMSEATAIRMLALDEAKQAKVPPSELVRLERHVADDFARGLNFQEAIDRWRSLVERGLVDHASLRSRIVFGLLMVGRPLQAQLELAQATLGEADVALLEWASEQDVDLSLLIEVLAQQAAVSPTKTLGIRLLAAADPSRAVEALTRVAESSTDPLLHASLVEIAFAAGVDATFASACEIATTTLIQRSVLETLLHGPFSPDELFGAVERLPAANSVLGAAVARSLQRPDTAWRLVEGENSARARVEAVLAAGALGDPQRIDLVPREPLDPTVEAARVGAFLAAGEVERARLAADGCVAVFSEAPQVYVARARLRLLDQTMLCEAVADFESAIRLGETSTEVWYAAARAAAACGDPVALEDLMTLRHTIATSRDVDAYISANEEALEGSFGEAEETLRRLAGLSGLETPALQSLMRLWTESGRVDSGRRWLENRRAAQPAREVWDRGLAQLDVVQGNVEAILTTLRERASREEAGFALAILGELLGDVERADEDVALERKRLERYPSGASKSLGLAAILIRGEPDVARERLNELSHTPLTSRQRSGALQVAIRLPQDDRVEVLERLVAPFAKPGGSIAASDAAIVFRGIGVARGAALLAETQPEPSEGAEIWLGHGVVLARTNHTSAAAALLRFQLEEGSPADEAKTLMVRPFVGYAAKSEEDPQEILATLLNLEEQGVDLAKAFELAEDSHSSWRLAAAGLVSTLGFESLSIVFLEDALRAGEKHSAIRNNLGFSLLELDEDRGRAMELIETAVAGDPTGTSELDSLGWLRYKMGRHDGENPEGALAAIAESIRLRRLRGERPSAEVLLHLGDASWRAGQLHDAQQAWMAIVEAKGAAGVEQQYKELYEGWLGETFGVLLVEPQELWERLDGKWIKAAKRRLEALAENADPPVEPTWAELDSPK